MTVTRTTRALLLIVVALIALGIVMLASTSSVRASATFHDASHYIKRQLVWLIVAVGAGAVVYRIDYHWWRRLAIPIGLVALTLLVLVLIPGIGLKIGGSRRWLGLGPVRLQPSEFAKIAMVIAMATWLCRVERRASEFRLGLLYPAIGLGCFVGLTILEPDFGTTLLMGSVGMVMLFGGGSRISHLLITGALGFCAFMLAILRDPVRLGRIMAFLFPEKYPETAYHLTQSKLAFIKGGLWGAGLGNSIQKQFYLPEAHTDFILAIIGEELGLMATGAVLILFVGILVCGMTISTRAPDSYGRLLAFGLTILLVLQAAINIGVVTGCMPTKGLPLPFISYGGSSMVVSVTCIAILLNISRQCLDPGDGPAKSIRDRAHNF
ncbi:MAG: putative lipid II flippase FtsW [Verrucomicrobia bacterium]|nr:putative lipid II flippase FtsW [Verrucomicrobiota bacterium]